MVTSREWLEPWSRGEFMALEAAKTTGPGLLTGDPFQGPGKQPGFLLRAGRLPARPVADVRLIHSRSSRWGAFFPGRQPYENRAAGRAYSGGSASRKANPGRRRLGETREGELTGGRSGESKGLQASLLVFRDREELVQFRNLEDFVDFGINIAKDEPAIARLQFLLQRDELAERGTG
jgi:hypothetical protein